MERQHIRIKPEGKPAFHVLFNPSQYGIDKSNNIAEAAVPGLPAPILQYVHGNTRTLSMELFFDTYEERKDVRTHTDKVYALLEINGSTHAPPICRITWGNLNFRGVLDHVSGKFTLFLANGTPVRATLSVTFKEFIDVNVLIQETPTQSADHTKYYVVKTGDRIDIIAGEEYGDPSKWRPIADANNLDDPTRLQAGDRLVIPPIV
jgi:hypothetical protein